MSIPARPSHGRSTKLPRPREMRLHVPMPGRPSDEGPNPGGLSHARMRRTAYPARDVDVPCVCHARSRFSVRAECASQKGGSGRIGVEHARAPYDMIEAVCDEKSDEDGKKPSVVANAHDRERGYQNAKPG
jgi:hypothetical protein